MDLAQLSKMGVQELYVAGEGWRMFDLDAARLLVPDVAQNLLGSADHGGRWGAAADAAFLAFVEAGPLRGALWCVTHLEDAASAWHLQALLDAPRVLEQLNVALRSPTPGGREPAGQRVAAGVLMQLLLRALAVAFDTHDGAPLDDEAVNAFLAEVTPQVHNRRAESFGELIPVEAPTDPLTAVGVGHPEVPAPTATRRQLLTFVQAGVTLLDRLGYLLDDVAEAAAADLLKRHARHLGTDVYLERLAKRSDPARNDDPV